MSNFFLLQPPRSFFSQSGTRVLGMWLVWEFWLGFFLCYGVGDFTDDRWYSKYSQVTELTVLENKCSVAETKWFLVQTAPCYSEGETGARYPLTPWALFFHTILCCLSLLRRNYMLGKMPVLLYSSTDLAVQGHGLLWMRMRVWAAPSGRACTLTFSVPYFPQRPLSMIHCFLRPFPLHPIDGFQSYLNFQVLTCSGGDQGCALLSYGLHKVTAGEREEAGRAFIRMYCFTFSIHHQGDDSILVKIHWTPIKSDGCYHCKLKSCQAIIGTNAGPWNGGLWASDGLLELFLVILVFKISSQHFIVSVFSAVVFASDKNLVM